MPNPHRATGPFEVKLEKKEPEAASPALGRMTLDKAFHGDLEAVSKGQMLAAGTGTKGSAGYVAIEVVDGTLAGLKGTFVLQHSGTMNRGEPMLLVTVVPDSGTGELVGLRGKMGIRIEPGGRHFYDFTYEIAEEQ